MPRPLKKPESLTEFIHKFRPELDPAGNAYFRERDWSDEEDMKALTAVSARHIWTIIDGVTLISGIRWVNRTGYVICEKPFPATWLKECAFVELDS